MWLMASSVLFTEIKYFITVIIVKKLNSFLNFKHSYFITFPRCFFKYFSCNKLL